MKFKRSRRLGFEVDKLTSSIEDTFTGERLDTVITRLTMDDLSLVTEQWSFDWSLELREEIREVYKLTIRENPIIQGLMSLEERHDHIFIDLIESAPFNIGHTKRYKGVPGNLVAFACKASFERGFEGFVSFIAKTRLIEHYEATLGAKRFWGNRMLLDTSAALKLVRGYFKNFNYARL